MSTMNQGNLNAMKQGHLNLVGLGPGNMENMTFGALKVINEAEVIAGYGVYIDLIRDYIDGKKVIETGMGGEIARTKAALIEAGSGKIVSLVCSGDASLYGLAGLAYELNSQLGLNIPIKVFPGITAASSCNSILGAPIVEDFCTISLSDYMTPWEKIEMRLELAAKADFVIAFYNPRSKARPDRLEIALKIIRKSASAKTPVGVVRNAYREDQSSWISTLEDFDCEKVDMFCTVIVGNSNTKVIDGKMVTSRGYKIDSDTRRNV